MDRMIVKLTVAGCRWNGALGLHRHVSWRGRVTQASVHSELTNQWALWLQPFVVRGSLDLPGPVASQNWPKWKAMGSQYFQGWLQQGLRVVAKQTILREVPNWHLAAVVAPETVPRP